MTSFLSNWLRQSILELTRILRVLECQALKMISRTTSNPGETVSGSFIQVRPRK